MKRDVLETEIQRQIEAAIGAERDLLLLRNSVGQARHVDDESGREWHVPYGLGNGSPDLVGILGGPNSPVGVWLCLEVKAPSGVVEPDQRQCHNIWRSFGALVYVVRSVKDAVDALREARLIVASKVRS